MFSNPLKVKSAGKKSNKVIDFLLDDLSEAHCSLFLSVPSFACSLYMSFYTCSLVMTGFTEFSDRLKTLNSLLLFEKKKLSEQKKRCHNTNINIKLIITVEA